MTEAQVSGRCAAWFVLALACLAGMNATRADSLQDRFDTVWESLWYQGGSPSAVARWNDDLRVSIQGVNLDFHRQRILEGLKVVADEVGKRVIDVTDAADAAEQANLRVEIKDKHQLRDNQPCYVQTTRQQASIILRMDLKLRVDVVYRCILHEAMHVMGIHGHPSGDTILSYFHGRADRITELDRLMLKAWYSRDMPAGATPFRALVVLTDKVVEAAGDTADLRARQRKFLDDVFAGMETFAGNKGEIPVILKRSGKVSTDSMRRGRMVMKYFVGTAYAQGNIVPVNQDRAIHWFTQAAKAGHAQSQFILARNFENGSAGAEHPQSEAYVWYRLALAQVEVPELRQAVQRVSARLDEEQRKQADARVSAFKVEVGGD